MNRMDSWVCKKCKSMNQGGKRCRFCVGEGLLLGLCVLILLGLLLLPVPAAAQSGGCVLLVDRNGASLTVVSIPCWYQDFPQWCDGYVPRTIEQGMRVRCEGIAPKTPTPTPTPTVRPVRTPTASPTPRSQQGLFSLFFAAGGE